MAYQRKESRITVWRVNHGAIYFSPENFIKLIQDKVIVADGNNADRLKTMRRGDYFYLCYDSTVTLVGKIIDNFPEPCPMKRGFLQRHYEMLFPIDGIPLSVKYSGIIDEGYKPGFRGKDGTKHIYEILIEESTELVNKILKPFFYIGIKNLAGLWRLKAPLPPPSEPPPKIFPLNQILFGPPGTGKTFLTTAYAVSICGSQKLEETLRRDYDEIKHEYNQLRGDGRIKFVTFHQSYGYEDFIEGIKPTVTNGNILNRQGVCSEISIRLRRRAIIGKTSRKFLSTRKITSIKPS